MRSGFVDSCILGFCLLACLQCILVSTDATNSFYVLMQYFCVNIVTDFVHEIRLGLYSAE